MYTYIDFHMNLLDQIFNFTLLKILISDWRSKVPSRNPRLAEGNVQERSSHINKNQYKT